MNIEILTQKIIDDLENALANMSGYIENPQVKINTINARVGQLSSSIQSSEDLSTDIFSKDNGWVVDFEFQPSVSNISRPTENDDFTTVSTFPWFEELPINALKGLGQTWQQRLKDLDITNIRDLHSSNAESIKKIATEFDSVMPMTFKRMTELLDEQLPQEVYQSYFGLALTTLLNDYIKFSNSALQGSSQSQLTLDFINNCQLCIDQKFIVKIILN
ncbi:hypothetical protein ACLKMH_22095 [Psychromonas sp. KJ10-10]|uniref:hypothetical protein n=1 Tax=Psychromonas sp. KJ10-10 TaxID=3391823 RepID=UPI0039B6CE0A